jgi:hypothetical protein
MSKDSDLLDWIQRSPNPRLKLVTHEWVTGSSITYRQAIESVMERSPDAGFEPAQPAEVKAPMTRAELLDLLHRCQNGEASCMFTLKKIEEFVDLSLFSYLTKS